MLPSLLKRILGACLIAGAASTGAAAQDYSPGGFGPSGLERYGLRHGDVTSATGGTTGVGDQAPQVGALTPYRPPGAGTASTLSGPLTNHPLTVRRLQEALNQEGHRVDVTGTMDTETRAALRLYQERHGLVPNGFIDRPTLRALENGGRPLLPGRSWYLD